MKRLVVCTDGTWNIPDKVDRGQVCPSNVVKMVLAVAPQDDDGIKQVVFYGKGVGTGIFDRVRGGAFGWGLSKNVLEAYRFIVDQYEPGDEIFLFGFSRGAYTVRSTAGLIRNSGVLRRDHRDRIAEGHNLYRRRDHTGHPAGVEAQIFRRMYSHEVRIKFIGVWDTVGALGIPVGIPWLPISWLHYVNRRWEFHDVRLSSTVDNAYHAIAIDERRPQFTPTLWEQQPHATGQNMEQVWFAGVHTNVGGGYQDSGLSDTAFLWMKEKAKACGLAFDEEYIQRNVAPDPLGELRDSRVGLYKRIPEEVRPIGHGHETNEAVHRSAVTRLEEANDPAYTPSNLLKYLRRDGKVTPP